MIDKIKNAKEDAASLGRKYRLSLISILVIFGSFTLSGVSPGFAPIFEELIGGVVAVLFVYCGGNITNKWVQVPKKKKSKKEESTTESE